VKIPVPWPSEYFWAERPGATITIRIRKRGIVSQPTQTCTLCGRVQTVVPDGRGFPPDIAKRRLQKACGAAGCPCKPEYRAGFSFTPLVEWPRDVD
jgi:hypothetical protein